MRGGLDGQAETVQIILRLNLGNANSIEHDIVLGTRVKRVKMIHYEQTRIFAYALS